MDAVSSDSLVSAQVFEGDKLQRMKVGGLKHDGWGFLHLQSLSPTTDTEAPMVAGLQAGEVKLGHGCGEVIAACSAEGEELFRHHGTDGVQTFVIRPGAAVAVAVEAGDGGVAAPLQGSSEDIGGHVERTHHFDAMITLF